MTINFIRVPAQNETCVYCTKRVSFTSSSMLAQSLAQSEACTCCTDADQEAALVKYGVNPRRVPTSKYHPSVMAYADKVLDRMEARKR